MRALTSLLLFTIAPPLVFGHTVVPHRRATDTCANIKLHLQLPLTSLGVQVCACVGQLNSVISGNPLINAAVGTMGGLENVMAMITTAIGDGNGKCSCTYPDYAIPTCSEADLCNFKCPVDRVKFNKQCVCRPGKYECNGKCTSQPCSSQVPSPSYTCASCHGGIYPRNGNGDKRSRRYGTPNWARRSMSAAHCPAGTVMCGVLNQVNGWECVKVDENLESCGGCAVPFFPGQTAGVDCSALPGVDSVGCVKGMCQVIKCAPSWAPSLDKHSCERDSVIIQRGLVAPGSGLNKSGPGGSSEPDAFRNREW